VIYWKDWYQCLNSTNIRAIRGIKKVIEGIREAIEGIREVIRGIREAIRVIAIRVIAIRGTKAIEAINKPTL